MPTMNSTLCWLTPCAAPNALCCAAMLLLVSLAPASAQTTNSPNEQVVVLTDGRTYAGVLRETAGGYRIDRPGSSLVVPFNHVRLIAPSLNQAYERLASLMVEPTATDHLQLAEWCFENGLLPAARQEVARALALEPNRSDARAFLKRVEETVNFDREKEPSSASAVRTADGFLTSAPTSAHGLSQESQHEFIRRIQPLIMNRCGNAYCHGSAAKNEFRFRPIRTGLRHQRLESEQNLEMLQQFIDASNPDASPLLRRPTEAEGPHRKVFRGAREARHLRDLTAWVHRVAQETRRNSQRTNETGQLAQNSAVAASASSSGNVQLTSATDEDTTAEMAASDAEAPSQPKGEQLIEKVLADERTDAFDPEIFNRRVHGTGLRNRDLPANRPGTVELEP